MITRPQELNHMTACFALNEPSLMIMINRVHTATDLANVDQKKVVLLAMMEQFANQMNHQNFNVTSVVADVKETMFAHEYTIGAESNPFENESHKCELLITISKTGNPPSIKVIENKIYDTREPIVETPKLILP